MSRKLLLFLVEGQSDVLAFEYPFGLFFEQIDPSIEVRFLKTRFDGDITSCSLVDQNNIADKIDEWWGISNFLSRNGFDASDVLEVIQISDIDGAYIPDENVIWVPRKHPSEYCDQVIRCDNKERMIDRNKRKRHNFTSLKSLKNIQIQGDKIKYSIFYFACNMDHFICGDRNLANGKIKCEIAEAFAYSFDNSQQVYDFFSTSNKQRICVNGTFKESWDFLKKETNSLKACSNIVVLFNKYRDAYENIPE